MDVTVVWPARRRALAALLVPLFVGLAHYARVTTNEPSERAAHVFLAMALGAVVFSIHLAVYRLEAGRQGLTERRFWGTRRIGWREIRKVELIGQAAAGGTITRWRAGTADAFHVVLHTSDGMVNVHRWMDGVPELLQLLDERDLLARDDREVASVLAPTALGDAVQTAQAGVEILHVVGLALPASFLFGLLVSLLGDIQPTGNVFFDAALVSLLPWGAAYLAYVQVCRSRSRRFGAAYAKPPLSFTTVVLATLGATFGLPMLVAGSGALAAFPGANVPLLVGGLVFCWYPISEIRRVLRER